VATPPRRSTRISAWRRTARSGRSGRPARPDRLAEKAGNKAWYPIEHADDGKTQNPLADAQVTASAQLVEVLSRFAGFPLQVTDAVTVQGSGTHVMGGDAGGGHTCPGPGPRAGQRGEIIARARAIRAGQTG
jgi:hypothetical protein